MKLAPVVLAIAACGGGGGFPTDAPPEAPPPGGKFSLAWSVVDTSGTPITCTQVGASFVSVTMRNRDVLGGTVEVFGCDSAMATSLLSFLPGTYDIAFELTGPAGKIAAATSAVGVEIRSNETVMLPPITFQVDATGKLELTLDTGVTGGNCAGGANVTGFTITLENTTTNACEPVTFQIAPGTPTSYTVDCANPPLSAGCIDTTQTLSVPTMPSGRYRTVVRGFVGAAECYTTTETLVVPPLSQTLTQTLNLTPLTNPGC